MCCQACPRTPHLPPRPRWKGQDQDRWPRGLSPAKRCVCVCVCVCVCLTNCVCCVCVSAASSQLEADTARRAAGVGGPGAVPQGPQHREGGPHHTAPTVVVPPGRPAPVHSAPSLGPRLLPAPVLPLAALSDVGIPPQVPRRWAQADGRWPLQDRPEGLGQERVVFHGHRVPPVPLLWQEGGGLVAGHFGSAEHSSPRAIPGCSDVQVCDF